MSSGYLISIQKSCVICSFSELPLNWGVYSKSSRLIPARASTGFCPSAEGGLSLNKKELNLWCLWSWRSFTESTGGEVTSAGGIETKTLP